MNILWKLVFGSFERAQKKGGKIAFGTDAGVFPHGLNGKEFYYMVEVGMSEIKAIQSATIVNARILKNDKIGLIAPQHFADIIAATCILVFIKFIKQKVEFFITNIISKPPIFKRLTRT